MKIKRAITPSPVESAFIIPRDKHPISKTNISNNALKILNRLSTHGFGAYLVGGSVRDLLLNKAPKDFDIATNATPSEIKNLFRNARIIGRRFKLVHILFQREIIEVATFRGNNAEEGQAINEQGMLIRDNTFGKLDEDAFRRDFTINSLYYNLADSSIIDFTGGVQDVRDKLIRMIGDPTTRYKEDPVRMLRAIRFSAKLHFKLEKNTEAPFPEISHLISHISSSRLFDEISKLYQSGEAEMAQELLIRYGLFEHLCPQIHALLSNTEYPVKPLLDLALRSTDTRIREGKPVTPAFLFAILLWFPMIVQSKRLQSTGLDPLPAIEKAMSLVIHEQNQIIFIPKRYTQVIREIWLLQYRLAKRSGNRAFHLLQHPRFRAAYDFMALRALAQDETMELAQWWTDFQEVSEDEQQEMVRLVSLPSKTKQRRKKPEENT